MSTPNGKLGGVERQTIVGGAQVVLSLPNMTMKAHGTMTPPTFTNVDLNEIRERSKTGHRWLDARDRGQLIEEIDQLVALINQYGHEWSNGSLQDVDYLLIKQRAEISGDKQFRNDAFRMLFEIDRLRRELGIVTGIHM